MKTMTYIALCASLLAAPVKAAEQPPRQDGAGLAVGAVVICVGGYCIYKLVKVCQKLFPKEKEKTNSTSLVTVEMEGEEYGASWNYGAIDYCGPDDENSLAMGLYETNNAYVATIKVTVGEWGQVMSGISAGKNTSQTQSWPEFQQEVASHGLIVSGISDGSMYFSRNRVPCASEAVPIAFDEATKAIIHTGGSANRMRTISIERSPDFQNWSHFLTVQSTFDSGFEVQDLTRYGQMFYRINVR